MPDSHHEHARRDDALMSQFADTLKELAKEVGALTAQCHSMEVQLASLTAMQKGEVEQLKYRVSEMEKWRNGVNKIIIGIITTMVTGIAIYLFQALLRVGVK
jgi:hypothetical protein